LWQHVVLCKWYAARGVPDTSSYIYFHEKLFFKILMLRTVYTFTLLAVRYCRYQVIQQYSNK